MRSPYAKSWILWALTVAFLLPICAQAQEAAQTSQRGFIDRVYKDDDGSHKYVLFVPKDYDAAKQWPIILFLHGAGERGKDGIQQTRYGIGPYIKAQEDTFPFITVFPQCEKNSGRILNSWSAGTEDSDRALKILEAIEDEFNVDTAKRYLTGWSMGGYGVWNLAAADPKRWTAIVPLAGGGNVNNVESLKDSRIWAFHGSRDEIVYALRSKQMVESLRKAGGNPRHTEFTQSDHDVWRVVYSNPQFFNWLLDPDADVSSLERSDAEMAPLPNIDWVEVAPQPFKPAIEMPNAIYARLGNEFLNAVSYAAPNMIPKDALSGSIEDIQDSTVIAGRQFDLYFSDLSYSGKVSKIKVKAIGKDRLNIDLRLQELTLTVGSSQIVGRRRNASAGQINIYIANENPISLSMDVKPVVKDRKMGLELLDVEFEIPAQEFSVSEPNSVTARGLGMTKRRVSEGLVDGFYSRRGLIETKIKELVPTLLAELEKEFTLDKQAGLVNNFWPLPVYKPDVIVWPSEILTDENGITVTLGLSAGAVEGTLPPDQPRIVNGIGLTAAEIPKSTDLRVGVAPQILRPMTELLIEADVARIHVLDIVDNSFDALAERSILEQAIPDLKSYGKELKIASELVLAKPLNVLGKGEADQNQVVFDAPQVVVEVSIKRSAKQRKWTKYASFNVQMQHTTQAKVIKDEIKGTSFQMNWIDEPQVKVTGNFAEGVSPQNQTLNTQMIGELFAKGWRAWTHDGPVAKVVIPDISIGTTKIRMADAGWNKPHVFMQFETPPTRLTNRSDQPIVYETRGPYSAWGGPYTLPPGQTHEYTLPYPLLYRRQLGDEVESNSLAVGSDSEFRQNQKSGDISLFARSHTIQR